MATVYKSKVSAANKYPNNDKKTKLIANLDLVKTKMDFNKKQGWKLKFKKPFLIYLI